jgi:ABC-type sugar transport system ATPase subunit/ribose/xylose/arabinose/galactoside ABC-type transport system permease subunit
MPAMHHAPGPAEEGGAHGLAAAAVKMGSEDLVFTDVRKSYGGTQALRGASLRCRFGEVHGLVGENGAGKSTLVKILSGAVRPDGGSVTLAGHELSLRSPADARANGIGTVFQELSLIPDLSVAANLLHGIEPRVRFGRVAAGPLHAAAREALERYGVPAGDVSQPVRELRLAERQVLEIVKTLIREPRVLLLDEATSALLPEQVEWLFNIVRDYAAAGGCAIFISHRLAEIEALCDRVTVFRAGKDVGAGVTRELPEERLVELMLGRKVERIYPPKAGPELADAPVVCELRGFGSAPRLRDVDLVLRRGELVGVGGLDGQGQAELFGALFGTRPAQGHVVLGGREVRAHGPAGALAAGIALVPEDRAAEGLCLSLGICDNVVLSSLPAVSRLGLIVPSREQRMLDEAVQALQITMRHPREPVGALSGGNQQKVLLSRVLARTPSLLLLYDATRGVDVGTKAEIYRLMREQAAAGVAVLFYSSDAAELATLADRVIVLHDGAICAHLEADIAEEDIVAAAVGGGADMSTATIDDGRGPSLRERAAAGRRELARAGLSSSMPYLYVGGLALAIWLLEPALIDGPGAVDVRFSAVVPLALVAFGQTLVMFTRGIDLAVGGVISTVTALLAAHAASSGAGVALEVAALVLLGGLAGLLNGAAITVTRLQPFIVTLATWSIWGGVALVILPQEGGIAPPQLTSAVLGSVLGVPKAVWVVALLIALWLWLRATRLVRDLRAIGSDEQRARLIGVPIGRRKLQCYALSGTFAALAGIWVAAQTGSGSPTAGDPFILNSVAAVVVGGTSIFGGTGSAAASVVGAIAFLMIPDLIAALQMSSFWSVFFQGALLVVAVTASSVAVQLRQRRGAA